MHSSGCCRYTSVDTTASERFGVFGPKISCILSVRDGRYCGQQRYTGACVPTKDCFGEMNLFTVVLAVPDISPSTAWYVVPR